MAKPIRATPELKGEDANLFLKKMIKVEKTRISKIDKELVKEIGTNHKSFKVY